jgi:ubiquinone/menaquinone biosynthesis C-methylase UbiE
VIRLSFSVAPWPGQLNRYAAKGRERMDEAYKYNKKRWEALVQAKALFTRPWLGLNAASARERLDRCGLLGDLNGKKVLCLAGGGGQQSAAFALLGAKVSVLDISDGQLAKDCEAAAQYGVEVSTHQGDMRELSAFEDNVFDIVWHPYALNFIPDCRVVFKEVGRILRPKGLYHFMAANPFAAGMGTNDWNGDGYVIRRKYIEEDEIKYDDQSWVFQDAPKTVGEISSPLEYRQTLGRILNGLIENNFVVFKMLEWAGHDQNLNAEVGDWEHFTSYLPPWLCFWTLNRPDLTFAVS